MSARTIAAGTFRTGYIQTLVGTAQAYPKRAPKRFSTRPIRSCDRDDRLTAGMQARETKQNGPGERFRARLAVALNLLDVKEKRSTQPHSNTHQQAGAPRFGLGRTCITPGAQEAGKLPDRPPIEFLRGHLCGDQGFIVISNVAVALTLLQDGHGI